MIVNKEQQKHIHKAVVSYAVDCVYNKKPEPRRSAILAAGETYADGVDLSDSKDSEQIREASDRSLARLSSGVIAVVR